MKNFLFALRYLRKLRGGTVARVVSLSLGLAVGLLVFSYANYNLTSDRCFPDRERIFQLWAHYADPQHSGYSPQLNAPIAPALAEEVPQVEAATRLFGPRTSDIVRGDNAFQAKYIYADTMFFDVLGFEPMNGNPKEILLHADQVMLAESFSRTIFGRKDPVGQLVLLNGTDSLTVMGLFRDPNPNQHLGGFNMLCSFEIVKRDLNTSWQGGDSFPSYVKLHEGASVAEVEAQLPAFFDRHGFTEDMKAWNRSYRFFPITESSRINTSAGLIAWVLMALAALTLFVASMNYVLISISTLVSRSKTIAMLKVGGARPSDIFRIFCSETGHTDLRFGHRGRIPVVGPAGSGAGDYRDADVRTLRPEAHLGAVARHPCRLCPCRAYPVAYFHFGSRDIGVPRGQRQPPPVETDAAGGRDRQLYVYAYAPVIGRVAVR